MKTAWVAVVLYGTFGFVLPIAANRAEASDSSAQAAGAGKFYRAYALALASDTPQ